jgi:hypothetical protein
VVVAEVTTGVNLAQYLRVQERIRETGTAVAGRVLQVCYGDETNLEILTVYETREAYDNFTKFVLLPILTELDYTNVDYQSTVVEVRNLMVSCPQETT